MVDKGARRKLLILCLNGACYQNYRHQDGAVRNVTQAAITAIGDNA